MWDFRRAFAFACALPTLLCCAHVQAHNALGLVPRGSETPSFDCSNARIAPARFICADGDLAQLDSRLGAAFQRRKSQIAATEQQKFVAGHATWIRERNKRCNLTGDVASTDKLAPSKTCMVSAI
jgi:uncharacterized protein